MKRVMCLYRVSTRGQVDKQDDIPMQRRECKEFISRRDDWVFIGERMEKGVSGYKVSAAKRDAIIEIREMAEKKQFDVLLVFMFDRLGRKEDSSFVSSTGSATICIRLRRLSFDFSAASTAFHSVFRSCHSTGAMGGRKICSQTRPPLTV